MGLFNKFSKSINTEPDIIGELLKDTENDISDIEIRSDYILAFNVFRKAFDILGGRINASFSITIKEEKVIMIVIDKWKIYWLADDPKYITIRDDRTKFDKYELSNDAIVYIIDNLDKL
jgi:hypothetical protein